MFGRLLALASVTLVSYLTGFLAATVIITVAVRGFSSAGLWEVLGNSMPALLLLGTVGSVVVAGVATVRRRVIAQTALGRWLGIVAVAGAVQFGLAAALGYVGLPWYNVVTIGLAVLAPPLVTGTLLFQKRTLGLRHSGRPQLSD